MITFFSRWIEFFCFLWAAGAEGEISLWGELEADLVSDAAHGPAGIEFDDGLPSEVSFFILIKEGVEAERAEEVVLSEEAFECGDDLFFERGEDAAVEKLSLIRAESLGVFGAGFGAFPLAVG